MINGNKKLKLILAVSIFLNFTLGIYIYNNVKMQEEKQIATLAWSDEYLSDAVNNYGDIDGQWDVLSEEELVQKLGQAESDLYTTMILMSLSDSYFAPVKQYWNKCRMLSNSIVKEGKNEKTYNLYMETIAELRNLWIFLAENSVTELGIDEIRNRWNVLGIE